MTNFNKMNHYCSVNNETDKDVATTLLFKFNNTFIYKDIATKLLKGMLYSSLIFVELKRNENEVT